LGVSGSEHGAEGRDLDHLGEAAVLAAAAEHDVDDAEAPADDESTPEQRLHLLGRGVGGDVEVLRAQAEEQVAHGAADDVGLVAGVGERRDDLDGALVDQRRVDAVLRLRHLDALAARNARAGAFGLAQELGDELLDHANNVRMRQSRSRATASSSGEGLVATGSVARSSSARSLSESLKTLIRAKSDQPA